MKRSRFLIFVGLIVATAGCNLAAAQPTTPAPLATNTALPTAAPPTVVILPSDTPVPTEAPTPTLAPSPTSNAVIITASTGGINVRRGPGVAYNVVGGLQQGNTATALARNEDGAWLFIPIPGNQAENGWISTLSGYSTIQGSVNGLVIQPHPPAVPAYLRNCTFHPMLVKPGDVLLVDQTQSPNNKKQFNPGDYQVYDQTVNALVKTIRLHEGDSIDITTDGLNNTYACP
jgi:hypothetical protein